MADKVAHRRIRWLQSALGVALIFHALGHASAVINTGTVIGVLNSAATAERADSSLRLASLLSAVAMTCMLTGGLGALSVRPFAKRWVALATVGLTTSLLFLLSFEPGGMLIGASMDAVLFVLLYQAVHTHVLAEQTQTVGPASSARRAVRWLCLLAVVGMAFSLMLRPVFLRWNTRPREAYYELPGDLAMPGKGFQILHAINIDAPAEQVWPWLAQIGHDRGGFYSYSWLENLFGLHIVNADRIHPAWQARTIGELVPATPHNWLGLVDRPLGWRVARFEPGQLLFLENWGAFALVRTGPATTRLYIRTQGDAAARASLWWSPLEVFVFEPAHFIMQRRMLLGIRDRAERSAREQRRAVAVRRSLTVPTGTQSPDTNPAVALTSAGRADSARLVARGQQLFDDRRCARCHTIGHGYKKGPELAGVTERRSFKQINALLTNTEEAIQTDYDFQQLRIELFLDMPNLNLSRADALALYYYLRDASAHARATRHDQWQEGNGLVPR